MPSNEVIKTAFDALLKNKKMLCTAESCTGGLIASSITSLAGSSAIFDRGFVTYSNAAKHECLGVSNNTLESHGAVSHQVAKAMAIGALKNSNADIAISVTGIAGPDGGSAEKPVGLVYIGWAAPQETGHLKCKFTSNDRNGIQNQTTIKALEIITSLASGETINDKL